jgi:hypothetical protein
MHGLLLRGSFVVDAILPMSALTGDASRVDTWVVTGHKIDTNRNVLMNQLE